MVHLLCFGGRTSSRRGRERSEAQTAPKASPLSLSDDHARTGPALQSPGHVEHAIWLLSPAVAAAQNVPKTGSVNPPDAVQFQLELSS